MVVAEAWLLRSEQVDRVECILLESCGDTPARLHAFFDTEPGVELHLHFIQGLADIKDAADHDAYEEVLWRWYAATLVARPTLPIACMAGGRKTMTASLQRAAQLFGAAELLHVLCPENPDTPDAVRQAHTQGAITAISLGHCPGWSVLRDQASMFPVARTPHPQGLLLKAEKGNFREHIHALDQRIQRQLSEASPRPERLLPALATAPSEVSHQLEEQLDPESDSDWLWALPKIDLHCHLGGFATHGEALQRVRNAALQPPDKWPTAVDPPEGWPLPEKPVALDSYMALGDANGSALLRDAGCLREQVKYIYEHFVQEGLLYAEVRCSPNNYATLERSAWQVLSDIIETFDEASAEAAVKNQPVCKVNLIVIVTRKRKGDLASISRHLALAVTAAQETRNREGCRVVGLDLAGYESEETRPLYFAEDFNIAHRCGLAVTAHAGENDDAESIWQAVHRLFARRIGHGLNLEESQDLMRVVRDRRIGVEMCPLANDQIKGFAPDRGDREYPLLTYLRGGIPVTVNTDNIGISGGGLTANLQHLGRLNPDIRRREIILLQLNALETAFLHPSEREHLRGIFNRRLQASLKHLITDA